MRNLFLDLCSGRDRSVAFETKGEHVCVTWCDIDVDYFESVYIDFEEEAALHRFLELRGHGLRNKELRRLQRQNKLLKEAYKKEKARRKGAEKWKQVTERNLYLAMQYVPEESVRSLDFQLEMAGVGEYTWKKRYDELHKAWCRLRDITKMKAIQRGRE